MKDYAIMKHVFATLEEAEQVYDVITDSISLYGLVDIEKVYDAIGIPTAKELMCVGWTSIDGFEIKKDVSSKGWALLMPIPVSLKN